mmetsp:Transcript_27344/g.63521  ORF Transcript_27344/g.63521 Transcript_27344/m.63521 type:complete len:87 (-) Transcript_27344:530-790(-)
MGTANGVQRSIRGLGGWSKWTSAQKNSLLSKLHSRQTEEGGFHQVQGVCHESTWMPQSHSLKQVRAGQNSGGRKEGKSLCFSSLDP